VRSGSNDLSRTLNESHLPTLPLAPASRAAAHAASLVARPVALDNIPRAAWDRLVAATPAASPFARWTFHRAWWDAYGSTAHEQYLVCAAVDADASDTGAIRAIVPLMHRHAVEPDDQSTHTVLRHREHELAETAIPAQSKTVFFAASYHADYATLLAAPADLPAVAWATVAALAGEPDDAHGDQPWDVVDLRRLRKTDPALAALESAFEQSADGQAWSVLHELEDVCPVISTPSGDWDEYLATLDKTARHEIRRKLRRAATVGELSVEIGLPSDEAIDQFIELHRARFGEDGLFPANEGGERSEAFIRRLAALERTEPDGGQMRVARVYCGPRLVYVAIAFDDGATCYLYNAGMDPQAALVSPGVTGTALYLQDRLAAGRRRFDFLRGDEPYKYEWGAVDEPIERLLVQRTPAP
jgi:CelD/BcsL family acetyltransferase involved in cellulose biosynthesis